MGGMPPDTRKYALSFRAKNPYFYLLWGYTGERILRLRL